MLTHEQAFWRSSGNLYLAGIDEAGRGSLAGPVVAVAVVITSEASERYYLDDLAGLNDSKKLSAQQREKYFALLLSLPEISIGVGWVSSTEIDELNILVATHLAMRRALEDLPFMPAHALVDGLPVNGLPCESTAIVDGDAKSMLIAAASIIAKVSRDHKMVELDSLYPGYMFSSNKGYGTHEHVAALIKQGPCAEHRHSFRPVQDVTQMLPGLF